MGNRVRSCEHRTQLQGSARPVGCDEPIELRLNPRLLRRGQPVHVQHAVQVVVLVLKDAGLPAVEPFAHRLAAPSLELDLDPAGAVDVGGEAREGETALLVRLLPGPPLHDSGVAEHHLRHPLLLLAFGIEDHETLVDPELRCRQPDPARGVHDGEHLPGQLAQRVVEGHHLRVWGAQQWVRVLQDAQVGPLDRARVDLLLDGWGGMRRR
mmetsp:Transcript_30777/g.99576  ORF Transcript_30777/g.99576 Transcript_30777/m.99576 type:complete len:210 (+) Transcript_30777:129-758(+)